MAKNTDVALPEATLLDRHPMRDDEGHIREDFVAGITRAIQGEAMPPSCVILPRTCMRPISANLVEALPAELPPKLVELAGDAFHFSALTEVDEGVATRSSRN